MLGSGIGVVVKGVTVIVSTKKSHPLVPEFGVVIVTEVIGCAATEMRKCHGTRWWKWRPPLR